MEKIKKWADKYRMLCTALGLFGLLLSPFLWPFFLAILLNSLSLAVPVLVVMVIMDYKRKEKRNENEINGRRENRENVNQNATEAVSGPHSENKETTQEKCSEKEKLNEKVPGSRKYTEDRVFIDDEESYNALSWYALEGKERIHRLMRKQEREGIYAFSISPEGICTVKDNGRFRRIGVLRSFPPRIQVIERQMNKDGIKTNKSGKYLWISWGKGKHR